MPSRLIDYVHFVAVAVHNVGVLDFTIDEYAAAGLVDTKRRWWRAILADESGGVDAESVVRAHIVDAPAVSHTRQARLQDIEGKLAQHWYGVNSIVATARRHAAARR